jgi:deazaflavin-dependent oxidoreductase (nitroreductase family)
MGLPVLLLTARGRKSGVLRTKALMHLPHGQDFVVIGSNLGSNRPPAWWLNLQADPTATVQVGGTEFAAKAREAQGQEREELWQSLAAKSPAYDDYKEITSRTIPVVILERL